MDLFPTIIKVADAENPAGHAIDGFDLHPQLLGQTNQDRKPNRFLMHFPHQHRSSYFTSFRSGDWKLIYHYFPQMNPAKTRHELFNLADDPYETNNLAQAEPEQLKAMVELMIQQLDAEGAQYPVDAEGNEIKPIAP
jgi:arylsulfatase A-like enzyme